MCGIFGFVLPEAARAPALSVALRALDHRGPDGRGTWEERLNGTHCGLAHTRLAILDLTAGGAQPMASHDGRYVVTFNGEIYNFRGVRAQLLHLGVVFRSESDTEVLLAAFAHWGDACLERLRGMFAFGIWDRKEQRLFLARDRMGVKPLYWVQDKSGGVLFSSEIRALLATGAARRSMSRSGLESYLAFGSVNEPNTMLDDVKMVQAGTWLSFSGGTVSKGVYWEIPTGAEPSEDRSTAVLRSLLADSIDLRLEADVPVATFLSGGIDSAVVTILAAQQSKRPLHTFTVTFDSGDHEGASAHALSRSLGCVHHEARLNARDIPLHIDAALSAMDQPSSDGVNTYFVSQAARATGLAVALSGIGSDEIFAGYRAFRSFGFALSMKRRYGSGIPKAILKPLEQLQHVRTQQALSALEIPATPFDLYSIVRAMFLPAQRQRLLADHAIHRLERSIEAERLSEAADAGVDFDAVNAFGVLELTCYLRNTLLRDTDVMSMAHGLEVREPFLDHVLVEFVQRVSGPSKLSGPGNKPFLTAAVPEVPLVRRRQQKRGFTLPFDQWLLGPLRGWAERRFRGPIPALLDAHAVRAVWQDFLATGGRSVSWSRVWTLVALLDWCARHEVA